jgi:hypothetical protein
VIELIRHLDWSSRLLRYITTATSKTFKWGEFDCALNAADSTLAITGVDLVPQFRGQYSNEEEAFELLRQHGYKNTFEFALDNYPTKEGILNGFSGDLGAFDYNGETIVGLIYQSRIFSPSPGTRGMGSVNLGKAHTVFKVGEA